MNKGLGLKNHFHGIPDISVRDNEVQLYMYYIYYINFFSEILNTDYVIKFVYCVIVNMHALKNYFFVCSNPITMIDICFNYVKNLHIIL